MAVRKRFTADELAIVADAGTRVEWQNGSQWHPATVTGEVKRDDDGWESVPLENHAQTPTISAGVPVMGTPGHVRRSSYVGPSGRTPTAPTVSVST